LRPACGQKGANSLLPLTDKSFLVLFFKKELLFLVASGRRQWFGVAGRRDWVQFRHAAETGR
jgi:hypothetical protein